MDIKNKFVKKRIDKDNNNHNKNCQYLHLSDYNYSAIQQYEWIEKLLETPIEDGRKYALWKILCPYLVNVKKLEYEQSYQILKTWLKKV